MKRYWIFVMFCAGLSGLYAQKPADKELTLEGSEMNLREFLDNISRTSGLGISYNPDLIPAGKKVSFKKRREVLGSILAEVLEGTGLTYKFVGNQIVIVKSETESFQLSGLVFDSLTGENLIGAHIWGKKCYGKSNEYGFYSMRSTGGLLEFSISYLGYQTKRIQLDLTRNQRMDIALAPQPYLAEVVVSATAASNHKPAPNRHPNEYPDNLQYLPVMGGEPDLYSALRTLPSVSGSADGFGGLYVRGGEADQNIVLLDDVPVYNPSHAYGILSIFNPDMVRDIRFLPGGFPARYSGKLSSILDVRTREGNSQCVSGSASASLGAARALLELPLANNKGALLLSGRTSLSQTILTRMQGNDPAKGITNVKFSDLNVKFHYTAGNRDKTYFSFYEGRDMASDSVKAVLDAPELFIQSEYNAKLKWGNRIFSGRWNHIWGDKLFSNMTVTYSRFHFQKDDFSSDYFYFESVDPVTNTVFIFDTIEYQQQSIVTELIDRGVRADFHYFPGKNTECRFGATTSFKRFSPGKKESNELTIDTLTGEVLYFPVKAPQIFTSEVGGYAEWQHRFNAYLQAEAGANATLFNIEGKMLSVVQPRLQINYYPKKSTRIYFSTGKMAQFTHIVSNVGAGLPEDFWIPANETFRPQTAWQTETGWQWEGSRHFGAGVSIFYKNMDNLVSLPIEDTSFLITGKLHKQAELFLLKGAGFSYGAEFQSSFKSPKTTSWLTYSWTRSRRKFEEINGGELLPFRYNRTHEIKVGMTRQLTRHWTASASWYYGSGTRIMIGYSTAELPLVFLGGQLFSANDPTVYQLPDVHRLDLALTGNFAFKGLKHQFQLGVNNAYNHRNVLTAYLRINEFDPLDPTQSYATVQQVYMLPILPVLSYKVEW